MQVLSISTPISVPSIKYSLQCVLIASAREADGASVVTGYERGVDMASYECSLSDVDIIAADFSELLSHRNLLHHPDRSLHFFVLVPLARLVGDGLRRSDFTAVLIVVLGYLLGGAETGLCSVQISELLTYRLDDVKRHFPKYRVASCETNPERGKPDVHRRTGRRAVQPV